MSGTFVARLRWIFVGSGGIRAGWSVLIFLGLLTLMGLALGRLSKLLHVVPGKELPPSFLLIGEGVSIFTILLATAIMARIEHRSIWSYGLGGRRKLGNFVAGFAGGLVALSVLVGMLNAAGYLVFDGFALHGMQALEYGLVWLLAFLCVAVAEETAFRGYLQTTLTRGMGFWPGAVVLSLLFAAAHLKNHGETLFGLSQVAVSGMVFCLLLRISGSLWLGIGFHAAWDWAQSYLYGTPDSALLVQGHLLASHAAGSVRMSGGSAGPEGSLLAGPVQLVGLMLLVLIWRRAGFVAPAIAPAEAPATI